MEQSSCKQTGHPRNISVLSDISVRNAYFDELPDWDLTIALHIYLFMIVLGVRFASSYPIYLKKTNLDRGQIGDPMEFLVEIFGKIEAGG